MARRSPWSRAAGSYASSRGCRDNGGIHSLTGNINMSSPCVLKQKENGRCLNPGGTGCSRQLLSGQARKFLVWGSRGDVLLVREAVPGHGSQLRGWMNCAALSSYLLGRRYWVWTPHGLYKRLLKEPNVCHVDVSILLEQDLDHLASPDSRVIAACPHCMPDAPRQPGAAKPFCMKCGRDFESTEGHAGMDDE